MNVNIERLPDCMAIARVEVPRDAVLKEEKTILAAFQKQARLPGFRPGKAPKNVILNRYKKAIQEELQERLVRSGCDTILREKELPVIEFSKIKEETFHPDETFSFQAEMMLAPDIDLPVYKEIPLQIPKIDVTEEEIEATLESIRTRFAEYTDVQEEGRTLQMDDFVVLDYIGTVEGKPLKEFSDKAGHIAENKDYWLRMHADSFLPGFCEQLEGAKIGESRQVKVTLNEEFPVSALRGKEVTYAVTIKMIKEQTLPELNDALAQKMYPDKNLSEIRGIIKEQLLTEKNQQVEKKKTDQIIEYLNQKTEFELPSKLINKETQHRVNEMVEQGQRYGMKEEEIQDKEQEIIETAGSQARINVKTSFILQKVAEVEKIKPSQKELMQRVELLANQYQVPLNKFMKQVQKNNGLMRIQNNLTLSKTLDFLKSNAKLEEVEPEPTTTP